MAHKIPINLLIEALFPGWGEERGDFLIDFKKWWMEVNEEFADRQDMVLALNEIGNFMLAPTAQIVEAERQQIINGRRRTQDAYDHAMLHCYNQYNAQGGQPLTQIVDQYFEARRNERLGRGAGGGR